VTNPTSKFTGAIHVYGGDFFETERSEWDPQTLEEHPYDVENVLTIFERSNTAK
jgi:predicted metal-dependent enzyme (double-stranded beta helix superfamily)